jgi:hypothetical protein
MHEGHACAPLSRKIFGCHMSQESEEMSENIDQDGRKQTETKECTQTHKEWHFTFEAHAHKCMKNHLPCTLQSRHALLMSLELCVRHRSLDE